jgi:hypothetical protein
LFFFDDDGVFVDDAFGLAESIDKFHEQGAISIVMNDGAD